MDSRSLRVALVLALAFATGNSHASAQITMRASVSSSGAQANDGSASGALCAISSSRPGGCCWGPAACGCT